MTFSRLKWPFQGVTSFIPARNLSDTQVTRILYGLLWYTWIEKRDLNKNGPVLGSPIPWAPSAQREREREREREVCFHMFFSNIGGFKGCPKRATRQFRSPIETACRANRKAHGGTMAKPAGCFESCCGRLCGAEAFESCCDAFEGFKDCLERATRQFRSPIETAFWANREAPWQHQQHTSRAAAEGCAVLRPSRGFWGF